MFNAIGHDSKKYRFEIRKVDKEKAIKIRKDMKIQIKINRICNELPNIDERIIRELVIKNNE